MMTTATPRAPERPHSYQAPVMGAGHTQGMNGSHTRHRVNRGGTADEARVPCGCTSTRCATRHGPGGCDAAKRRGSRTCRPCYLANLGADEAKYEAGEHAKFLARMLTSAGRRAADDDPGQGLAMLLEVQRRVDALVAEVGAGVLARYMATSPDGLSQMARDLTYGTGEPWSRQRVHKRWAAKQNGNSQ